MKKAKDMLNEKMQVRLPETLSTENIMANIENSKAEIVEMPKKKNTSKKKNIEETKAMLIEAINQTEVVKE